MKLKTWAQRLFPKHARVPMITVALLHFVFYFIPPLLVKGEYHYDLTVFIDGYIPFVPIFIIFYIGAYLQWGISYIWHFSKSRSLCVRLACADLLTKAVAALFFIFLPTVMLQPVPGDGVFAFLVKVIYFFDEPVNLFPSLHCAASWLCFRSALPVRHSMPRGYVLGQFIFTLFVFASTVFVKQHVVVDILGGVIVAELAWLLSSRLPAEAAFEKIEAVFTRNKINR